MCTDAPPDVSVYYSYVVQYEVNENYKKKIISLIELQEFLVPVYFFFFFFFFFFCYFQIVVT